MAIYGILWLWTIMDIYIIYIHIYIYIYIYIYMWTSYSRLTLIYYTVRERDEVNNKIKIRAYSI